MKIKKSYQKKLIYN